MGLRELLIHDLRGGVERKHTTKEEQQQQQGTKEK